MGKLAYSEIIIDYIKANGNSVKEYFLLSYLQTEHTEFFKSLGKAPSLYKRHFFLFNYLYQIDEALLKSDKQLNIDTLNIAVLSRSSGSSAIGSHDSLKAFYSDSNNLNLSENEVVEMQKQFWKKYLAVDKKAQAIIILGLQNTESLNLKSIKRRFNQLAQTHHPDKGGDAEIYAQIQQAYQILKLAI